MVSIVRRTLIMPMRCSRITWDLYFTRRATGWSQRSRQRNTVIELLEEGILDVAQLHGDETEEDIQYLQAVCGKPVIKAVKVRDRYDVEAWLDSSADYLLFDNGMGTGQAFDWSVLGGIDREFFLAGGLQSENLTEAMEVVRPYAVDISSGIESDRKKDPEKMHRIMELVERYRNTRD